MDLVEASRPPDPELVDLIEQAFIEGQIDSEQAGLAYSFLVFEMHLFEAMESVRSH